MGLMILALRAVAVLTLVRTCYLQESQTQCSYNGESSFTDFLECISEKKRVRRDADFVDDAYGHPCHSFINLNAPERRVSNRIAQLTADALCDRTLKRRWYRFDGPSGGLMPEKCVEEFSCGTHAPIWLNGKHPTEYGVAVDREVCMSLAGTCCQRRWYIRVANCGDFFTYLLTDTPGCFMAYCAGTEQKCPEGQSSRTGYTPGCSDNFPHLSGSASLTMTGEGHEVKFYCDFDGPIPLRTVLEVDWFVDGPKSGRGSDGLYPIWTDYMRGRRRSILTEGRWMGKMGSEIYCKVRAKWDDGSGVHSPPLTSDQFFAGIQILETTITVSEAGEEALIQMKPTVPIKCLPQFDETCKVTVELAHDTEYQDKKCVDGNMRQVVFGDCKVDFTPDNWDQVHNVSVKAVRDFYNDGTKRMAVNFKPTYSTSTSPLWNSYKLPGVDVLASDAPTKMCTSTGDPHYSTFDGLYYHVYLEGEFVMYKHKRLPIQINTRLEKCGKVVTCNCAVAVMVADDVVVIDRCNRKQRNLAFGKSFPEGWRTLHRHALQQGEIFSDGLKIFEYDDGRRYTIHMPTGAYLEFLVGKNWINLHLYASSDDWQNTAGLCGTFDGNKHNDLLHSDGFTLSRAEHGSACGNDPEVCSFAQSWRVPRNDSFFKQIVDVPLNDEQFFNEAQYCKCEQHGGSSKVVCNYNYDIQNCQAMKAQENGEDKTESLLIKRRQNQMMADSISFHSDFAAKRKRRSTDDVDEDWEGDVDDYFQMDFEYDEEFVGQIPQWPTPRGITEDYARTYCSDIILRSTAATACSRHIRDKVNEIVDACMTDIKVTDDLDWAVSSLETFTSECVNEINDKATLWRNPNTQDPQNENGPPSMAERLLDLVCPNDCSRRGVCTQGSCVCNPGLTGRDCSVRIDQMPQIMHVSGEGLCDVRRRPCNKIQILGEGFVRSAHPECRFTKKNGERVITEAIFETFEEISCILPTHQVSFNGNPDAEEGNSHEIFFLIVYQGAYYTERVPIIVYNSGCVECNLERYPTCTKKDQSCQINGHCFAPAETHPNDCCLECNPQKFEDSFTQKSGSDELELFPKQESYTAATGSPFTLRIHANHPRQCPVTYTISSTHEESSAFQTNNDEATITIDTSVNRAHYFDVIAEDGCKNSKHTAYSVFVMPEGEIPNEMTYVPRRRNPNRDCAGNHAPSFPDVSVSLSVIYHEVVPLDFAAIDVDADDQIVYYILKPSSAVNMAADGSLSYLAPTEFLEDKLTMVAEDECGEQARLEIVLETVRCPCDEGLHCVPMSNMPRGRMHYDCI